MLKHQAKLIADMFDNTLTIQIIGRKTVTMNEIVFRIEHISA